MAMELFADGTAMNDAQTVALEGPDFQDDSPTLYINWRQTSKAVT